MVLRRCSIDDLRAVTEIEKASFKYPYDYSTFSSYLTEKESNFIIAEVEKKVVGYVIVRTNCNLGTIISIAVLPIRRRKGIGGCLLEFALKKLFYEVNSIELQVSTANLDAIRFYESHGFSSKSVIQNYYPSGEDAIVMGRVKLEQNDPIKCKEK